MEAIICAVISAVTTLIVSVGSFQVSVRKDREKAKEELKEELGDLGSIPGLGRSPGEGNGNPLQYFFFFLKLITLQYCTGFAIR